MAFKYTGILAKPHAADPFPGRHLHGPDRVRVIEEWERGSPERVGKIDIWMERQLENGIRRWRALYKAHGVPDGDQRALLIALVHAHVPGFREADRPGPKVTWSDEVKAALRIAVDDHIEAARTARRKVSISQACLYFSRREPWRTKLRSGPKANGREALRQHYNTADVYLVAWLRKRQRECAPANDEALSSLTSAAKK